MKVIEVVAAIKVEQLFETIDYDYPDFHLTMHCYICKVESGELTLKEHEAARWLTKEQLSSIDWLPADRSIISRLTECEYVR